MKISDGIITDVFAGGYIAQVTCGETSNVALWLSGILSGHFQNGTNANLGANDVSVPQIGSRVLVLINDQGPHFILGHLPFQDNEDFDFVNHLNTEIDAIKLKQHNCLISDEKAPLGVCNYYNNDRTANTLPGDVGWINELFNSFLFLRGIVALKTTDEAQIQLNTLDSLVRIIAKNFEFLSPCIESCLYDKNGLLSLESDLFKNKNELYGTKEEIFDEDGKQIKEFNSYARGKLHLGNLGNILNLLYRGDMKDEYIKPENEKRDVVQLSVNNDGAINVYSTNEIGFYQVDEIFFPERKIRYHEDQSTNQETPNDEDDDANAKQTLADITGTIQASEKFEYIDGSKIEQENIKIAFDQNKKLENYSINEWEANTYKNPNIEEENETIKKKISKIIQRKDGSILLTDRANSFIELDGTGNINISCPGNLLIRTGKDIINLSGNKISNRAKDGIEIISSEKQIDIKAETGLSLYNNQNTMLIENNDGKLILKTKDDLAIKSREGTIDCVGKNIFFDAASILKIESPLINIGTKDDYRINLNNKDVELTCSNFNTKITSDYQLNSGKFLLDCELFSLSANVSGYIHGGPKGTNINHSHKIPKIASFPYTIKEVNKPRNVSITISEYDKIDTYNLFDNTDLNVKNFKFNLFNEQFESSISETLWQRYSENSWNLKADEINNSIGFPGINFDNYQRYNPINLKFEKIEITEYKI